MIKGDFMEYKIGDYIIDLAGDLGRIEEITQGRVLCTWLTYKTRPYDVGKKISTGIHAIVRKISKKEALMELF